MRDRFLAGARTVIDAASDERVIAAWNEPSVLDEQTVGGLVGHLCRGAIWVVEDYLDRSAGDAAPDVETAADYFTRAADGLTPADHAAIRARGADVAAVGPVEVLQHAGEALARLEARLPAEPTDRTVAVYAGLTMRLDDYLYTRIVEQVVHLDDLARSIGVDPWPNPPDADALVVACGAEIGRLRHGGPAMIRTLFRDGGTGTLPVL
jgi:hypothetical protein